MENEKFFKFEKKIKRFKSLLSVLRIALQEKVKLSQVVVLPWKKARNTSQLFCIIFSYISSTTFSIKFLDESRNFSLPVNQQYYHNV